MTAPVVMPMFPLGSVLLPYQSLPLHVFEPRYRALVHDCLDGDRRFGVVLIERGSEVGGGDARFDVGCVADIVRAEELPDGRWLLVTTGVSRLRVARWLPDDPYPRADVELLTEPPWGEADEVAFGDALAAFGRVVELARRVGHEVDPAVFDLPGDGDWDHWLLADRAPVADLDRLALLAAGSPAERLHLLTELLAGVESVLASRLGGG